MLHYLEQDSAQAQGRGRARTHRERQPAPFLKGTAGGVGSGRRGAASCRSASARAFEPYATGGLDMPHGTSWHTIRTCSSRSLRTARSPSSRTAPRWAPASRTSLPMVIADEMEADWARVKIVQAPGDEPQVRQPGHRRLAQHAPPHPADAPDAAPRCAQMLEHGGGQASGASTSELPRRRRTTWCSSSRRAKEAGTASSASASWRTRPWHCRCRRSRRCSFKDAEPSSATSARARSRSTTCTTSPPARPSTAPMSSCRA